MTLYRRPERPLPDFWQIHGHSFFQFQTGPSGDQTGRVDALFRSAMDIEYTGWRNRANSGARICAPGRSMAGWTKVVESRRPIGRAAPYAPDGGASVTGWGWNDAAAYGLQNAATRSAMVDTHRAVISRCRASVIFEDDNLTRHAYGAGFASSASGLDLCSGGTTRLATTTTNATITFTIPADYTGEVIAFAFLLRPGATGGTLTFSGTAGVTGTFYVGGGGQSGTEHAYTVRRITNLTTANANQTIIMTVTQVDGAAGIFYDCCWLESKTPPPVLVCDLAKSYAGGTAGSGVGYYNVFAQTWNGGAGAPRAESAMDADVDTYNVALYTMIQEFDGMVQPVYCDRALNPAGLTKAQGVQMRTSDGIHPNEYGAGAVVDELVDARKRLTPPAGNWGMTLGFNPPSPRAGVIQRPHWLATPYHGADILNPTYTAAAVPGAAGDVWAFPFVITGARETFLNISLEVTTVGTVTPTIRWALYDDMDWQGYPQQQFSGCDTTTTTAFSPGLTLGMRDSTALVSGFGFVADPCLVWIVMKIDTLGAGQFWRLVTGQSLLVPNRVAAGTNPGLYPAFKLAGQGTAALPGTFYTGAVPTAGPAPALSLKRSK